MVGLGGDFELDAGVGGTATIFVVVLSLKAHKAAGLALERDTTLEKEGLAVMLVVDLGRERVALASAGAGHNISFAALVDGEEEAIRAAIALVLEVSTVVDLVHAV